jgi:hypothetical protein
MYANLKITRKFNLGEQRSLQARIEIQNVLNYAAFGNPNTDPQTRISESLRQPPLGQ